jgi:hypothetical protein
MVPADPEEGFRITDRRRRGPDDADAAPVVDPGAREAAPAAPPRAERPPDVRADQSPAAQPERNLTGLFVMLASSATLALGEAADPMTGEVHVDLDQAAEIIDLLALLREKTEGNRTPEETQVLEEVIYDLQLRYVAATRPSSPRRGPARS